VAPPSVWKGAEEAARKALHSLLTFSGDDKSRNSEGSPSPTDSSKNEESQPPALAPEESEGVSPRDKGFLTRVKGMLHLSGLNGKSSSRVPDEPLNKDDAVALYARGGNVSTSHRLLRYLVTGGIMSPFNRVFVPGLNESMYAWKAVQLGASADDRYRVEKNGQLMDELELKKELQKYHLGAAIPSKDHYSVEGKEVGLKQLAEDYTYLLGPYVTKRESYMPVGVQQFIPYRGVRLGFFDPGTQLPISVTINSTSLTDKEFWSNAIAALKDYETSRAMVFANGKRKVAPTEFAFRRYQYVLNRQLLDGIAIRPK
jgi:hypothetical protein